MAESLEFVTLLTGFIEYELEEKTVRHTNSWNYKRQILLKLPVPKAG